MLNMKFGVEVDNVITCDRVSVVVYTGVSDMDKAV